MALTTNGLNYIAQNFGINNCFVTSGLTWRAVDHGGGSVTESGGTKNVVGRLINDAVYARIELTSPRTGTYTKSQLISANDGQSITLVDVNNADPSYCVGVTPPPTVCTAGARRCRDSNTVEQCRADGSGWDVVQTCGTGFTCVNGSCVATTPPIAGTTVGPFEFEFGEVCTGDPTAAIDVSGLKMWQETDTFRMNNFMVTNTSNCIAYFATQLKLWPLTTAVPSVCPSTAPEWSGVDRSTWTAGDPYIEVATIAPGETKEIWLDFFVPATTRGRKVLCMYLWANFSKWDLYDELAVIGES